MARSFPRWALRPNCNLTANFLFYLQTPYRPVGGGGAWGHGGFSSGNITGCGDCGNSHEAMWSLTCDTSAPSCTMVVFTFCDVCTGYYCP